jgi:hypothetical protein
MWWEPQYIIIPYYPEVLSRWWRFRASFSDASKPPNRRRAG